MSKISCILSAIRKTNEDYKSKASPNPKPDRFQNQVGKVSIEN